VSFRSSACGGSDGAEAINVDPYVLVVEADGERGRVILDRLSVHFPCERVGALDETAAALAKRSWAAVVVGYDFPCGGSGLEVLQIVQETTPRAFRLFYSTYCSSGLLRDVERIGNPHFVADATRPDYVEALDAALREFLEPPSVELPPHVSSILVDEWTACSRVARDFLRVLRAAAEQETPVYVYGEPGTGRTRAGILLRRWRQQWRSARTGADLERVLPVAVVRVPSLRERPQDLPILAARCLVGHAEASGEPVRRLSARAIEQLLAREWQGNVVELSSVLVRAIRRMGSRMVIEAEDLPHDIQPPWRSSQYAKDAGQRDCVLRQLRTARSVSAAARADGCSRANYIRLMRRLGILRADVRMEKEPTGEPVG
jgi:DNA-binding NtrC family response regulator